MDVEKLRLQKCIDNLREQVETLKNKLQEEKANHQHTLECARQFEEAWLKMKRERDALMRDLSFECYDSPHACYVCKHGQDGVTKCKRCLYEDDCFEWRGLCKENGGVEE